MTNEFKSYNLNSYFQNVRLGAENQAARANIHLVDQSDAVGEDTLIKDQDSVEQIFEMHRMKPNKQHLEDLSSPKSSLQSSKGNKRLQHYLNHSLESSIISDVSDNIGVDESQLEDEEPQIVQLPRKTNKLLSLSKEQIDLQLIQTQSCTQTFKIVNRHHKRVTLRASLTEAVGGIDVLCPASLEPLSACDLVIEVGDVNEIGDVYNAITIEAASKDVSEVFQVPLIIHYTIPKLTVEYEGASQVLSMAHGKFMDIKLPQSNFREYNLFLSSQARLEVHLSTPQVEATVFPDEVVLMEGSKRKVGIRCRESRFCLVARVKDTQLAFVFRVTIY